MIKLQVWLSSKMFTIAIAAIVLLSIFLFGWWYKTNHYTYGYTRLDSYRQPYKVNPNEQTAVVLSKPTEFSQAIALPNDPTRVTFDHALKGKKVGELTIARTVTPGIDIFPTPFTTALNRTLTRADSNETAYQEWVKIMKNFDQGPKAKASNQVQLGKFKPFTNPSIKAMAWSNEFSSKNPDFQGIDIVAFGKKTIYYFSIKTVKSNWQKNQPTFKKVLDSIKIDQY